MKIYVELSLSDGEMQRLRSLANGDQIWFAEPGRLRQDDEAALREAEVVFGNPSIGGIEDNDRLRWVQFPSVGLDYYRNIDWSSLGERITCTNLSATFADPCAETALAGLLALLRGLNQLISLQQQQSWQKLTVRKGLRMLRGSHVLILGNGSIGRRFKELLQPFKCKITTFSKRSADLNSLSALDEALPHAEVVVAMLPGTIETEGLLDAARIRRFKPGAIFVNVGRGTVVDEVALIAALREKRLGGAVLDVTVEEPLPEDHPLWQCPNTVLTQHTGGGSTAENHMVIDTFEDNLERFRNGLPLRNVVDWDRGY